MSENPELSAYLYLVFIFLAVVIIVSLALTYFSVRLIVPMATTDTKYREFLMQQIKDQEKRLYDVVGLLTAALNSSIMQADVLRKVFEENGALMRDLKEFLTSDEPPRREGQ